MARLYISHINPLALYEVDPSEVPQYISKHMDDYTWNERLNQWQQGVPQYYQPWQMNDVIGQQIQNNAGQLEVEIMDCNATVIQSFNMDQKQQNTYDPLYFIYECEAALNLLTEGRYFFVIRIGSPVSKSLISEPLYIKERQENTLLIEYSHRQYYQNLIFETGLELSIRVHGILRLKDTPAKDTLYEDQVLDMVMVQSKPYRLWELVIFGNEGGVPDWMQDKISQILGCSNLRIDGKYFSKNGENAKWEDTQVYFNQALKARSIELREAINRNSKVIDTVANTNEQLVVNLNVDSKGFADTSEDASSSVIQISDIE